jgi:hypothetical protein
MVTLYKLSSITSVSAVFRAGATAANNEKLNIYAIYDMENTRRRESMRAILAIFAYNTSGCRGARHDRVPRRVHEYAVPLARVGVVVRS